MTGPETQTSTEQMGLPAPTPEKQPATTERTQEQAHKLDAHLTKKLQELGLDEKKIAEVKKKAEYITIKATYEQAKNSHNKNHEQALNHIQNKLDNFINQHKPESASTTAEAKKETKESTEITQEDLKKAYEKIISQFSIKEKDALNKIKLIMPELGLTKEQINNAEKSNLELSGNQVNKIKDAILPQSYEYDPKKGEMIHNLLTNDKITEKLTGDKKLNSEAIDAIDDLFDKNDDKLRQYLVMRYGMQEKNGKLQLQKDNGDWETIEDVHELTTYLPANAKSDFDKILKMNDQNKRDKDKLEKALQKTGGDEIKRIEMLNVIRNNIDATQIESAPGFAESLGMLINLIRAISKAFKTGDWEGLTDFMNDWKDAKNNPAEIAKRHERSMKSYKEIVKQKADTIPAKDLLEIYFNPGRKNEKANKLFSLESLANPDDLYKNDEEKGLVETALTKYRFEAKDVIKTHLAKQMNVESLNITKSPGSNPRLDITTPDNKKYRLDITGQTKGSEKQIITLTEFETKTEKGKENTVAKKPETILITKISDIQEHLGTKTAEANPDTTQEIKQNE